MSVLESLRMHETRRNTTATLCRTWQEEAAADREFWRTLSPAERVLATWKLSQELWTLKGVITDESRIRRNVTRVIKR